MDLNLRNKHALVCGSTQGIGKATAQELALLEASLTLVACKEGKLQHIPAGRFGDPKEVAAVAAFLATPAAAYINGVSIQVDGGRTSSH